MDRVEIYLTRKDVALRLGVTTKTVDRYLRRGLIKAIKVDRMIRIPESSYIEFQTKHYHRFPKGGDLSEQPMSTQQSH